MPQRFASPASSTASKKKLKVPLHDQIKGLRQARVYEDQPSPVSMTWQDEGTLPQK